MKEFRFGICAGPDQIAEAAQAGFDYIEMDLRQILAMDEDGYRTMAREMQENGIYAEVVYGMLPNDLAIVGDGVSAKLIHEALDRSFDAAQALGAEIVVFDCEHARKLPLRFDPAMAWRQMGNLIRMLQGYAADFDMKVVLLPLRRSISDLMNHLSEATLISAMLRLDRIGVMASSYNMALEAESLPALRRCGSLLWHMRTSNVLGNKLCAPGDGENYAAIFEILREMGYEGRISCEGSHLNFAEDAKKALECLKEAAKHSTKQAAVK